MGVENNEIVIATTWDKAVVNDINRWILGLDEDCQSLFAEIPGLVNGKITIVLAPCGSKKGWPEDKAAQELRKSFIAKLKTYDYSDGSSPFDWVEVGYGEFGQKVLQGNCANRYDDREYAE